MHGMSRTPSRVIRLPTSRASANRRAAESIGNALRKSFSNSNDSVTAANPRQCGMSEQYCACGARRSTVGLWQHARMTAVPEPHRRTALGVLFAFLAAGMGGAWPVYAGHMVQGVDPILLLVVVVIGDRKSV